MTSMAQQRKADAAERIGRFASAALQAAHTFDESGQETIARAALTVAQKADALSRYAREKDFGEIVDDASGLARRYPAIFIGGTFTAGLLLARFLKASQRRSLDEPIGTAQVSAEV